MATTASLARKVSAAVVGCAVAAAGAIVAVSPSAAQNSDPSGAITGLTFPVGVAVNDAGERFVVQLGSADISVYGPSDNISPIRTLTDIAGTPWAVAVDSVGTVYVSSPDAGRIFVFDAESTTPDREILDVDRDPLSEDDDDEFTDPFSQPLGIAVDASNNLYIANSANDEDVVYVVDAGESVPNLAKTISGAASPHSVAVNGNGDVFIGSVQTVNDTVAVAPAGATTVDPELTITGLTDVYGLTIGHDDELYAVDNTTPTTAVVRVYESGSTTPSTSRALTGLGRTFGLATSKVDVEPIMAGTVFAADYTNGQVAAFTPGPAVETDPADVGYGSQLVGTSSTINVSVSNAGGSPLVFPAEAAAMGTVNGQFSLTANTCTSATLEPTETCILSIRFTPGSRGLKSTELALTSNASDEPHVIPINGTGVAPILSMNPSSKDFGETRTDAEPVSQNFVVTNTGDADLVFNNTPADVIGTDSDEFTITADSCVTASIQPDNTCTITLEFDPTTVGEKGANLRLHPEAPETTRTYALSGTAVAPGFAATPDTVAFPNTVTDTTSDTKTITIHNNGTAVLTFTNLAQLTGPGADMFTIESTTCTTQLAIDATCTLTVTFTPTTPGDYTATITSTNDAPSSPQTITLTGTGVPPSPEASPSPSSHDYGQHIVGTDDPTTQEFTVTNSGTSSLVFDAGAISLGGTHASDFSLAADTCTNATIAIDDNCVVSVTFEPTTTGSKSAQLRLVSNEPGSPRTIGLAGNAIGEAAAPGQVSVTAGNRSVAIGWALPSDDGNAQISGYRVEVATSPGGSSQPVGSCASNQTSTSRSCTATGLANNVTYYFRVATINGAGTSDFAQSAAVVPRAISQKLACRVAKKVKRIGTTVVVRGVCRTNAGLVASVRAVRKGGTKVKRKGAKWLVVTTKRKGIAQFTFTAPARGVYLPMRTVVKYRN